LSLPTLLRQAPGEFKDSKNLVLHKLEDHQRPPTR
jgi:hypothetical protein